MEFFDTNISDVQTALRLKERGLPTDITSLRRIGIFPLVRSVPLHDSDFYRAIPSGVPRIDPTGELYVQDFSVVELTLVEAGRKLKERVTATRWQVETGGITLPGGVKIATGIDDQNRISSALQGMTDAGIAEVDFKATSGWVKLTREQLSGVAAAIAAHVQACFSRERALHELVDAAESITDLQNVDINAVWPGMDTPKV